MPHNQITSKGNMRYLEDRWGTMRLDQLLKNSYDVEAWLAGDLPLRTKPDQQASWQTRTHIRNLFAQMMKFAVKNNYLPYNPFTGLSVAGAERHLWTAASFISIRRCSGSC